MWDAIRNQWLFPIRQRIPSFRRRPYKERLELELEQDFIAPEMASQMASSTLRIALYYAWILEQIPWSGPREHQKALDLGSKNFCYAPALYEWLQTRNSASELVGLEADPARLYVDLFRREDYAKYYIDVINRHYSLGPYCYYQSGNWLKKTASQYDLITCFFPFIYDDLSDRWGLPRKFFEPQAMYEKCAAESPWVLFFHQGDDEKEDSLKILEKIGQGRIVFDKKFDENPYLERSHPTWALLWKTKT